MEQRKYKTKQEVLIRGQEAVGKTLGEIDKTGRIATGKGAVGTVIEESRPPEGRAAALDR